MMVALEQALGNMVNPNMLTYLRLDKMVAISQTIIKMHFCEWKVWNFDENFAEICP